MSRATFRWKLTRHGRSPSAAVALGGPDAGGFFDCFEECAGIDKFRGGAGSASRQFVVIHASCARLSEEIGNGDAQGIGDTLND
jgi:hypothetical protein